MCYWFPCFARPNPTHLSDCLSLSQVLLLPSPSRRSLNHSGIRNSSTGYAMLVYLVHKVYHNNLRTICVGMLYLSPYISLHLFQFILALTCRHVCFAFLLLFFCVLGHVVCSLWNLSPNRVAHDLPGFTVFSSTSFRSYPSAPYTAVTQSCTYRSIWTFRSDPLLSFYLLCLPCLYVCLPCHSKALRISSLL